MKTYSKTVAIWVRGLLMLAIVLATRGHGAAAQSDARIDESKWQERLDPLDRALLDELTGYAPPVLAEDLKWIGGKAKAWEQYRGSVVIVQSWSNRSTAGRRMPLRIERMLEDFDAKDVSVLLLHTPEGVDKLDAYLERKAAPYPVVVDATGAYCDALGVYKRPVNVLIDRNGTVRYAGLTARGLELALTKLVGESYDESISPKVRETKPDEPEEPIEFPAITGQIQNAVDLRGHHAPDLHVEEWLNGRPDGAGKVVIVDFWATWCGPCVASIPHMNQLATTFRNDVVIVGLSDETLPKFEEGMQKLERSRGLTLEGFQYAVALDSTSRMERALRIRAIPHALVMSSDWVVRWQGHPGKLSPKLLEQIVKADKQARKGNGASRRHRWTGT